MIRVERTPCPPALDPADETAAGPREFARLRARVAAGEELKSDDFSAYARDDVREALREMFHGKCAYCESKIAGGQDTDVEHYRPKKGITEAKEAGIDHRGYWWLAMVWENLVLSCQHCNQARSRQIIVPDHIEDLAALEAFLTNPPVSRAGKLNAFPTANNTWVLGPEGADISTEQPLIINPVDIDPEQHLDWVLFRGASTVRAKDGSPVGESTRRILGLNRRWLEEDRRVKLFEMQLIRNNILDAMNKWLAAPTEELAGVWGEVADSNIALLHHKTRPEQPFAALARAFLAQVRKEVASLTEGG